MMKIALSFVFSLFVFNFSVAQKLNSESAFREYFESHKDSLDAIEGIWTVSSTQEFYRYDTLYNVDKYPRAAKVAIMRSGSFYDSFNLTGDSYDVSFFTTDVKGVYLYKNFFRITNEYSKAQAVISTSGIMQYTYEFPDGYLKLKFAESYEEGTRVVNQLTWKKIFPEDSKAE